ncbi:hypothetical protein LJ656_18340 [Paraburkholderia sp. MMS20-SJTR3]|uniref:Uncharacterized protein n=1 Tax=Paraburkholderia sejongensis TaxID=2886946 RepID=A0ABS8JXF6_9BURK|nr:hypothetical protein [Paraburkholderia sp. MMS20-SJTR3]MCC8394553.1 hypothetical protein [Paraburkholderia sp. MMS20-SJTR3]
MAIFARELIERLLKVALFIGLLLISIRYVHTYPVMMPRSQLLYWVAAADLLGIYDVDDLYIPLWMFIQLIVAIVAYRTIMRLWQRWQARKLTSVQSE